MISVSLSGSILVADSDGSGRSELKKALVNNHYQVTEYDPTSDQPQLLSKQFDIGIINCYPGIDFNNLRKKVLESSPSTHFILMAGESDNQTLYRHTDKEFTTILIKPAEVDRICSEVRGILLKKCLGSQPGVAATATSTTLVGDSTSTQTVVELIAKYAPLEIPVLITGETGTGKEVVAHCIHDKSQRSHKKFIPVNCASLSPGLIESELFGHVQGAFTGAIKTKYGIFESAHGGTLFLDEIGELPFEIQGKFLRILDTGQFMRIGETIPRTVDVRILSATNRDLERMVQNNTFRQDLYFRLCGSRIHIPPLRDRKSDIPQLVKYFFRSEKAAITQGALQHLMSYDWPGNVRELKMIVEYLKSSLSFGPISKEIIIDALNAKRVVSEPFLPLQSYRQFKEKVIKMHEKNYFQSLLHHAKGNISLVARIAQLERRYLYDKLKSLDLMQ
ncbi:MAG: sigma-54-dependent Fis family transcriptional regulator [Chitinivibrionales bacterium]|nr:sigma-54-dependent Fis family transcriptional regulator [Chitinivibrionales bacterium]